MEKIKVEIKGTAPLLMNRYEYNQDDSIKAERKDRKYDVTSDAQKALYFDAALGCYAPSSWIEASLREAGKEFKGKGKGTLKATILASVFVVEEKLPLGKQTYDELDVRPVVIQRNRVIKGRPKFNSWSLRFTLSFNPDRVQKKVLRQVLEEAGIAKGIGDYRPKFGRFEVVAFN